MSDSLPIAEVSHLTVRYPDSQRPAIQDITLQVRPGDRLLIAGPSGSGKSTLLYAMAGVIPELLPAELEGSVTQCRTASGFVLQNPEAQMIAPTVEEEVAFSLENLGVAADEMDLRIDELLGQFGITALRARNPGTLSGGEAQKVALAAALSPRPTILFLDEPTAFLDPPSTRSFFGLLSSLDPQVAIVLVEHKIEYVQAVVHRYIMLSAAGRIAEEGESHELSAHFWFGNGGSQEATNASSAAASEPVGQTILEVRNLTHRYLAGPMALDNVSFEISRGDTVVVMGPNGSGKSTLLDRVAAVSRSNGSRRHRAEDASAPIRFLGHDVSRMRAGELYSRLLLVPQNPEHMFLKESVDDELSVQHSDGEGAPTVLDRFRLAGLGSRNPFSLSEGEKRRLNLACAFLDARELLLLDEPTYGLDAEAIRGLVESLRLLKGSGSTLLLVTHSPELAFLVADMLILLKEGRVAYAGNPAGLASADIRDRDQYLPAWLRKSGKLP